MRFLCTFLFILSLLELILGDGSTVGPTPIVTHPAYSPEEHHSNNYVPHKTYFDAGIQSDAYYPYPTYGEYYPNSLAASKISTTQNMLQTGLSLFYRFGFFVVGGAALLFVGGLLMTAVCSWTSFCTISFASFSNVDKDAMMRSFMTPDKLATAAAMVQDAFGKYQRLQKANKK